MFYIYRMICFKGILNIIPVHTCYEIKRQSIFAIRCPNSDLGNYEILNENIYGIA